LKILGYSERKQNLEQIKTWNNYRIIINHQVKTPIQRCGCSKMIQSDSLTVLIKDWHK